VSGALGPDRSGAQIGRYTLRTKLGEGAAGEVYAAVDLDNPRARVALKVLKPHLAHDELYLAALEHEGAVLEGLKHEHIVGYRGLVRRPGEPPALVLEYVEGGSVEALIAAGPTAPAQVIPLIEGALQALTYAHAKGVVHRDIKPTNLLLNAQGKVQVVDFGVAKRTDSAQHTSHGNPVGTWAYMAPERFEGDPATARTDLYALGLVAWELLAGQRACPANGMAAAWRWHDGAKLTPLVRVAPATPAGLAEWVVMMTARDAVFRPRGADDALEALRRASRGASTPPARPAGPPPISVELRPRAAEAPPSSVELRPRAAEAPPAMPPAAAAPPPPGGLRERFVPPPAVAQQPPASARPDPAPARRPGDRRAWTGLPSGPFETAYCPPGRYTIGSPATEPDRDDDEGQHEVVLTQGFEMGVYPVTQALWLDVMGQTPSEFSDGADAGRRPVESVSWYDCVRFCNRLSARFGLAPAYAIDDGEEPAVQCDFSAPGFRLPTEAEWEVAARAGQRSLYAGGDDVDKVAWTTQNSGGETHPVGLLRPNAWGLHDLSGNVWEWCWDGYGPYPEGCVMDPVGPTSAPSLINRGGSWNEDPLYARVASRDCNPPGDRFSNLGVRLLRTVAQSAAGRALASPPAAAAPPPPAGLREPFAPPPAVAKQPQAMARISPATARHPGDRHAFTGLPSGPFETAYCPPGRYTIGSPATEAGRDDDEDQHEVMLTRGFEVGVHPVTQALWQAVMGQNPSYFTAGAEAGRRPVERVSWYDCVRFCNRLSEIYDLAPAYAIDDGDAPAVRCDFSAPGFRLPTEAEWEVVARAGQRSLNAGGDDVDKVAWTNQNSGGETQPVGLLRPNAWGLHDLSGNIWEWCWDWYGPYPEGSELDPAGPVSGSNGVFRGGSWGHDPRFARVAYRGTDALGLRRIDLGVRLLRTAG
jgi:formylglycine-generating enzyme required for sulfatase activity